MKFARIKDNHISLISNTKFDDAIEVPKNLESISDKELILNYVYKNNSFVFKYQKKSIKDLKIAFVSNWKMRCGISTYIEKLFYYLVDSIGDYKLFIEENDLLTGDLFSVNDKIISTNKIIPCWKRGENLSKLIEEIKKYNPDIVFIQHEFGLWSNARYWLALLTQLSSYRIIVTQHSVFHHKDKTIVEAAIPEIVVHLEGAKKVLKEEKQIPGKVYVIPHGCEAYSNEGKLWNYYKSNNTFIQMGFGFRYKRFELGIQAVAKLKEKYPDIFYTILFSESPHNLYEHQIYYNELIELIDKLNVQDNVAIIRGYQSESTIDSYLRTNQVALFCYGVNKDHEVYGASGASRLAMQKGLPIISSSVPHFSDMPTIKADSIDEITKELDNLFSDKSNINKQISKQIEYMSSTNWKNVANMYIKIFEE